MKAVIKKLNADHGPALKSRSVVFFNFANSKTLLVNLETITYSARFEACLKINPLINIMCLHLYPRSGLI